MMKGVICFLLGFFVYHLYISTLPQEHPIVTNSAVTWVASGTSIIALTKNGSNVNDFVSVYSSDIQGFDLALSNCEQSSENYRSLYTDGYKFKCIRIK